MVGMKAHIIDWTDFALHQKLVPGLEAHIVDWTYFALDQKLVHGLEAQIVHVGLHQK